MNAAAFTWDTTSFEQFHFLTHGWDVRKAKELIAKRAAGKRPHPVDTFHVKDVAGMAGFIRSDPAKDGEGNVREPDLSLPVIIVTTPDGNLLPIDGWRRIRKALAEKREQLYCIVLSKADSKKIKLP